MSDSSGNGNGILGRGMNLAAKRKTVKVEVKELGCSVILRELSISQLNSIDTDLTKQLAMTIVDENGTRVFTSEEDIKELSEMSASVATFLIKEAAKLNGATKEAIDNALKNLQAGPSTGSVSA